MTEDNIIKPISIVYYFVLAFIVCYFGVLFYLDRVCFFFTFSVSSSLDQLLQYIVLADMLVTIPLGLYVHNEQCKKISSLKDKYAQWIQYRKSAIWRIILVSNTILFSLPVFFVLHKNTSILYVNFIVVISLYFTKPSLAKMRHELKYTEEEHSNNEERG